MSRHALDVLEFDRVLERVAARASSDLGRRRVLELTPTDDVDSAARELARVGAVMRFIDEDPSWGMPTIPDVSGPLSALAAVGAVLEPVQLHRVGVLLEASRRVAAELRAREGRYPELDALAALLVERRSTEEAIARCVDAEGHVLDTASRELKRIRDKLRGAHSRIVKKLERFLGTLSERHVVADGSVTIREGRYVIPIRREGKGEVGGIVHDESQSGATLFVEPPVAIALMNEVRELEREEDREIRRVLAERSDELQPHRDELRGALDALADFDALYARARSALKWRAVIPELHSGRELRIREGRHPLLLEAEPESVVPFDFELLEDERAVVVSGPNTGGKSVLLKATGLVCALAQSGVVPPVGKDTRLPIFGGFFADIGDEQSIAQSLSTFSAHLENLTEIVNATDERSLVLIDEMGTGTDPSEGAALARSILEELVERGATAVVTSHLGELKQLDTEGSGIVNASLQFDSERMEPTYRFFKGRPGRSYGLAIARRMGLPARVLDRAERYRDDDESRMEEVLTSLEAREREAERLVAELDRERARAEALREELDARELELREAERSAETDAREEARRLLLEARAEVEAAIADVRDAGGGADGLETVAHRARARVEKAARRHEESMAPAPSRKAAADVASGDAVRVRATGARGTVAEVRSDRAMVEIGAVRMEVPLTDLEVVTAGEQPASKPRARSWHGPGGGAVRTEVDLRGMRVDEIDMEVPRALDQALLDDLAELRIIHGKGTGALRARVAEILASDSRVRDFRMGGPTEGGAGVTVASFGKRT